MSNLAPPKSKIKTFALIRDVNGRPVIDDGHNLPAEIVSMLSQSEKEELKNGRYTFRRT